MKPSNNIFLIGPMGAGKTTIGRRLAGVLEKTFHDCDKAIEERTGASINLIFDIEGEAGFRRRERDMLDELSQLDDIILATGGGAVVDPVNRKHLSDRGLVIYLCTPLETLLERTRLDKSRPLLQEEDPLQKLKQSVEEREPLYREIADLIIETDNRTVRQIVNYLRDNV